ncbi:hypothetical protein OSCI_3180045 [Kamptonema sp. PCC 6506]|nr:hypothetical protein OSCI_3180045 [Kamptonema sp. PCC 6506]
MQVAPETGFLRKSVGNNEVFSLKNPVSLVGYVSPDYDFLTLYITTKYFRQKIRFLWLGT